MSYANATKRAPSRATALREIDSQAELELGHQLTKQEKDRLFRIRSPHEVLERIHKVYKQSLINTVYNVFIVWLRNNEVLDVAVQKTRVEV